MEKDDTQTTAFLVGYEKGGPANRPIYALFEQPESKIINTGYGASRRRIVTTKEVAGGLFCEGHGQVSIVPQSTLDVLFAAAIMQGEG